MKSLELELVEAVAPGETPRGLEVLAQVVDLFDGCDEGRVDGLCCQLGTRWCMCKSGIGMRVAVIRLRKTLVPVISQGPCAARSFKIPARNWCRLLATLTHSLDTRAGDCSSDTSMRARRDCRSAPFGRLRWNVHSNGKPRSS